jgi:hypothetical protein
VRPFEELTGAQRRDAGPGVRDFLHVVLQARELAETGGGAEALQAAYADLWQQHSRRLLLSRWRASLIDVVAAEAGQVLDRSGRHGRGTVPYLLEELLGISGAAHDAALAVLVRDLIDPDDFDLLTEAWRGYGLEVSAPGYRPAPPPPAASADGERPAGSKPLRSSQLRPGARYVTYPQPGADPLRGAITEAVEHDGVAFVGFRYDNSAWAEWILADRFGREFRPEPRRPQPAREKVEGGEGAARP